MATFTDQPLVTGGTYTFRMRARKDGATWDISGATVTLYLRDPDLAWTAHAASVTDGPAGEAEYTNLEAELDQGGDWERRWRVEKSGIVVWSDNIEFHVEGAPA